MPAIMIVGEAFGEAEEKEGAPFVGASGQVLDGMLRSAGINRRDCYLTNVFNFRPTDGKIESLAGTKAEAIPDYPQISAKIWIHSRYKPEVDRLWDEVRGVKPNIIIALGSTALWALCKSTGIKKSRGTPLLSTQAGVKVLPTYHPSAIMRQWKLRPIAIADIVKAKRESAFPEIRRPARNIYIPETVEDLNLLWSDFIAPAPAISCDIETKNNTITEVGFAVSHSTAVVIPFYSRVPGRPNYWPTAEEEFQAWMFVRKACADKPLIGQNFSYDIQYLWQRNHIKPLFVADDTMILHHALYPEMEKSLGFLGSIYTDEPSWKFMRTEHETLKKED